MIGLAPILNRHLSGLLADTAKKENIPFQYEVMSLKTGTDADAIAIAAAGVKTALISIPLRYMHTPYELVSLSDISQTAQLLTAVIGGGL